MAALQQRVVDWGGRWVWQEHGIGEGGRGKSTKWRCGRWHGDEVDGMGMRQMVWE